MVALCFTNSTEKDYNSTSTNKNNANIHGSSQEDQHREIIECEDSNPFSLDRSNPTVNKVAYVCVLLIFILNFIIQLLDQIWMPWRKCGRKTGKCGIVCKQVLKCSRGWLQRYRSSIVPTWPTWTNVIFPPSSSVLSVYNPSWNNWWQAAEIWPSFLQCKIAFKTGHYVLSPLEKKCQIWT